MIQGKRFRIYYMAQVGIKPPKFVLFVNYPNLMTETYKKYIYNQFREEYGFEGLPINIYLRGKAKREKGAKELNEHHKPEPDDAEEAVEAETEEFDDDDDHDLDDYEFSEEE